MSVSLPGLVGLVFVLAGFVFGGDWLKRHRESGRPSPSAAAPNVLLIVLDTVRADHLSLYGYDRPTTPALERWARRGILFSEARATAPWTLASHASLFTGRWPHELGVRWMTPLGTTAPTLAEHFGSRGYATAGFVANLIYCSYDTGLDRGFTHYEDYVLERLMALRTASLIDQAVTELSALSGLVDAGPFRSLRAAIGRSFFPREQLQGRRGNQSRIRRLAIATARAGTSLLRLSQLHGCPFSLRASTGCRTSFRIETGEPGRFPVAQPSLGLDRQAPAGAALLRLCAILMTIASLIWTRAWASCWTSWRDVACWIERS